MKKESLSQEKMNSQSENRISLINRMGLISIYLLGLSVVFLQLRSMM